MPIARKRLNGEDNG